MNTAEIVRLAEARRAFSHDPDTQTACVLVLENGSTLSASNCFPAGVNHAAYRKVRPEKYRWIEHAERRVIYNAAKEGFVTEGATAYMLFAPCMDCARALIQAGIKKVIVSRNHHDIMGSVKWPSDFEDIHLMFAEASVEFFWWSPASGLQRHRRTTIAEKIAARREQLRAAYQARILKIVPANPPALPVIMNISASGTMTGVPPAKLDAVADGSQGKGKVTFEC